MVKLKKLLCCIGLLVSFMGVHEIQAAEIRTVETESTIGFTGIHNPIGAPKPEPELQQIPDNIKYETIAKQHPKRLPKTNMLERSFLTMIGGLILVLVLLVFLKKRKKLT